MSAIATIPDDGVPEKAASLVGEARAMTVATPEQAEVAVEFAAQIADQKRRNEKARLEVVKPLKDHAKKLDDAFKGRAVPLEEADQVIRSKILAFQQEEHRRQAAEQARLDAERQDREEAAEDERREQAAKAAEAERLATEQEQARQAQLRNAQNERAREIALMNDDELRALAYGDAASLDARLAVQEMGSRETAREAQERAQTARREAEEAQSREIAEKSAPAEVATITKLASASGGASTRKRWTATVIDPSLVPREYLTVDQKAINAAVKANVREIPGVLIEQTDELAVRSSR